jgi:hypothetical protein
MGVLLVIAGGCFKMETFFWSTSEEYLDSPIGAPFSAGGEI